MGDFNGHALPGSALIIFGIWWTIQILNRYYRCLRQNKTFTSTVTFSPSCGRRKKWPIEGFIKMIIAISGIGVEGATARESHGNIQHLTMYFFWGLAGISDILTHYKLCFPVDSDYTLTVMALIVEGFVFKFHIHGRKEVNMLIHTLLIYAIVANTISFLLEMRFRHNVLVALVRSFCTLVHGTWLWQISFILYPPGGNVKQWDGDHEEMMLIVLMFAWHMGAVTITMFVIGGIVAYFHTDRDSLEEKNGCFNTKILINVNGDGSDLSEAE